MKNIPELNAKLWELVDCFEPNNPTTRKAAHALAQGAAWAGYEFALEHGRRHAEKLKLRFLGATGSVDKEPTAPVEPEVCECVKYNSVGERFVNPYCAKCNGTGKATSPGGDDE